MGLFNTKKKNSEKIDKTLKTEPVSAQSTIPYERICSNGIIEMEEGLFSMSYKIKDVDFATASDERQDEIFFSMQDFLNSLDPSLNLQISFFNRNVNEAKFEKNVLLDMKGDKNDEYRKEYNDMIRHQMNKGQNGVELLKYYTISLKAENFDEATNRFKEITPLVLDNMRKIAEEEGEVLSLNERLSLLYDICHPGTDDDMNDKYIKQDGDSKIFDLHSINKHGLNSKDIICPDGFDFTENDSFRIGKYYARSFSVADMPPRLSTKFIDDLTALPYNMLTSVFFETKNQEDVIHMLNRFDMNARANIKDVQKKYSRKGLSSDLIPSDLYEAQEEGEKIRTLLTQEKEKMFFATITITVFASTMEELDQASKFVESIKGVHFVSIHPLMYQQEQGFCSSLPLGLCKIYEDYMLTTSTAALFQPYTTYTYKQKDGFYYGINPVNQSMIIYNRDSAANQNGYIVGRSGYGKSFAVKREIVPAILNTTDDILIIDPQREYTLLAEAYNGSVIKITPGGGYYINPFDMDLNYADEGNPVSLKIDFITSLYETMSLSKYGVNPAESSLLNRCVRSLYEPYIEHLHQTNQTIDRNEAPTLRDLYETLLDQPEPEAVTMALKIEQYATGTLDCFQNRTNIDVGKRLTVYDIKEIGTGMNELGLQVALNDIWNRVISNHLKGIRTRIYIDEVHLLTKSENAAKLLQNIWKMARKWGGIPTAITQEVGDLLSTKEGQSIINNSDFALILNQQTIPRQQLTKLLNLSKEQQKYITHAEPGSGLLYTGNTIIPFKDNFPKETKLYALMSTDPKDVEKQKAIIGA